MPIRRSLLCHFRPWALYIRPSIALTSGRSSSGRTSSTIRWPSKAICRSASDTRPESRRPMEAPCGARSNPIDRRNRWSFSKSLRSSLLLKVRSVTATAANSKKESDEKSRFLPRFGGCGGGSWWLSLTRWTKLKGASGSVGVGLVSIIMCIMWRIVTDVRGNLMKIMWHNLNNDGALNIEVGGLRLSGSAFTGFCSFLLSRGSMAAPTAK
jgi:hypothetical protein